MVSLTYPKTIHLIPSLLPSSDSQTLLGSFFHEGLFSIIPMLSPLHSVAQLSFYFWPVQTKNTMVRYMVILIIVRREVLKKSIAYCIKRHHISKKHSVLMNSEIETVEACTQASSSSLGKKRATASRLSPWLYRWGTTGIKTLSEAPRDQSDFTNETLKHGLAYFPHGFTMEGIYVLAFPVRNLRVTI